MPMNRPAIPRELDRRIRVEAGHRCAIQTCRAFPIEIAHITPWRNVRAHEFANLIALCPTCHAMFDKGFIDRKAMEQHKLNLSPLSPFMMSLYPRHISMLADYKEFRDRTDQYVALWARFLELRKADRKEPTPRRREEGKAIWDQCGPVSREWWYVVISFAGTSGKGFSRQIDEVAYSILKWVYMTLRRPVPPGLPTTRQSPGELPAMWMDLEHAIHLELNSRTQEADGDDRSQAAADLDSGRVSAVQARA